MLDRFLEGGDGGRPTYWATALRMFAGRPSWARVPGPGWSRRVAYTEPGEIDFYIPHAHNQDLADRGRVRSGRPCCGPRRASGPWRGCSSAPCAVPTPSGAAGRGRRSSGLLYLGPQRCRGRHTMSPAILLLLPSRSPSSTRRASAPSAARAACRSVAGPLRALAVVALAHRVRGGHRVPGAVGSRWPSRMPRAVDALPTRPTGRSALAPALKRRGGPGHRRLPGDGGLAAAGSGDWATAEAAFRGCRCHRRPADLVVGARRGTGRARPAGCRCRSLARSRRMRLGEQQPRHRVRRGTAV